MTLFAFGEARCEALAGRWGTPLFAYASNLARARFQGLKAVLPSRVRLAFAVKANPHPDLLRSFADLGASFDCASEGELKRVAGLGLEPGRLFYAGPGKRARELALALELGARVQAEGWEDLARLDAMAPGSLEVNLRVHPLDGIEECSPIIGGTGPSAFGIDEEQMPDVLLRARTLKRVRIRGLHVFAASNERDARRLLATYDRVLALGHRLQEELGQPLQQIDLGGGLGVSYAPEEAPLDLSVLGRGLQGLLNGHDWFRGEVVMEPGRYLAAACGVYLVRVIRMKESRGTRFAILEGGVNHLLRPLLTGQPFPVKAVGKTGPVRPVTLAGPLCTSLDRLGDVQLPELAPGDLLAFGMVGAYGFTESMAPFLSHEAPREVWVP